MGIPTRILDIDIFRGKTVASLMAQKTNFEFINGKVLNGLRTVGRGYGYLFIIMGLKTIILQQFTTKLYY